MTTSNLETILLNSFRKFDKEIVSLNKEQLSQGEDNEGNLFGRYSPATQSIANSPLNEQPRQDKVAGQPYNFEWTGGLFDGMYLLSTEKSVEVWSRDSKTRVLNIEYPGLFGLNPQNLSLIIEKYVYPAFMLEIRTQLRLL